MSQGMTPLDAGFGEETEDMWGEYGRRENGKTTFEKCVSLRRCSCASLKGRDCRIRTEVGSYTDYYRNVAGAINGTGHLEVAPEQAELGIRIVETAKRSAKEGRTVAF